MIGNGDIDYDDDDMGNRLISINSKPNDTDVELDEE